MAERTSQGSIAAVGLGLLLGLGVAFVGYLLLQDTRAGDEPPIRVRNGTIELHLLHGTLSFKEDHGSTDKKKWRIDTDPERSGPAYLVVVVPSNPADCKGYVTAGNRVEFEFSEGGQNIALQATGKNTKIISQPNALNNPSDRLLNYGTTDGYITKIHVTGNRDFCTFTAKDPRLEVFILD